MNVALRKSMSDGVAQGSLAAAPPPDVRRGYASQSVRSTLWAAPFVRTLAFVGAKPEPRAQPKVEAESTAGRSPAAHQAAEPREQSLMQRLSRTRVAKYSLVKA